MLNNDNFPVIRIQSIVLDKFKSVIHGEVEMACSKKKVPMNTQSDILGLYGQNGSGKTSLIESLSILKYLLMGDSVPDEYADCIMIGEQKSKLTYSFDFQYKNNTQCKVIYEVVLGLEDTEEETLMKSYEGEYGYEKMTFKPENSYKIKVISESIKVAGDFKGGKKLQPIIDTTQGVPFGPASKLKYFVSDKESILELKSNRMLSQEFAQSFIFMKRTLLLFNKQQSEYIDIINSLQRYASFDLFVIDTKSSGLIRLNTSMPLIIRRIGKDNSIAKNRINLSLKEPSKLPGEVFDDIETVLGNINIVLSKLIPGLSLKLKDLGPILLSQSNLVGKYAEIVAIRDGIELPLRDESDGIRKIISTLQLYIEAYNDPSLTIAIDEFDAGIFEYLLGEMLSIFEETGKGQFIFTSHNLRPLEVINKNFICFTTTDPENRYTRLDNIRPNNNLRNVYFREIELGGEDEDLYQQEKRYKIVQALRKAGREINGEET